MPHPQRLPTPEQWQSARDMFRSIMFGTPPGQGGTHPGVLDFTPLMPLKGMASGFGKEVSRAAIAKVAKEQGGAGLRQYPEFLEGLQGGLRRIANKLTGLMPSARGQRQDLVSVGNQAILENIDRVNPELGEIVPFLYGRAAGQMRDYLGKDRVANLPKEDRLAFHKIRQFENQWKATNPGKPPPSDEVVAMRLFVPRKASPEAPHISQELIRQKVEEVRRLRNFVPSLRGVELEAPGGRRGPVELETSQKEPVTGLSNLLGRLNERERRILELSFDDVNPRSDADIAKELGISRQRVAQLKKKAIDKIQISGGAPSPEDEWFGRWREAYNRDVNLKKTFGVPGEYPDDWNTEVAQQSYALPPEQAFRIGKLPDITNLPPRPISQATQAASEQLGVGRLRMPSKEPDPSIVRQLQSRQSLSQMPTPDIAANPELGLSQVDVLNLWSRDRAAASAVSKAHAEAGYNNIFESGRDIPGMPQLQPGARGALDMTTGIARPIMDIKGEAWRPTSPETDITSHAWWRRPGRRTNEAILEGNMTPQEAVEWMRQMREDARRHRGGP